MDQKIYALFEKGKIFLKDLKRVDLSQISAKRSLQAYLGINLKGFYQIVFIRNAKSRLLVKEAREIDEICAKCEEIAQTRITKRAIFFNSAICSKSSEFLKQNGWTCYDFM